MKTPQNLGHWAGALLLAAAPLGCEAGSSAPSNPGVGGSGGSTGDAGGNVGGATAGATSSNCTAPPSVVPQRIVRLDYAQLEQTIEALAGPKSLEGAVLEDPQQREFQSLFVEGRVVNLDVLRKTVGFAELAANSLVPTLGTFTGCAQTDEVCLTNFVTTFAGRAYRRPLADAEKSSLLQLFSELKAAFATSPSAGLQEAARYAIEGVLTAPGTVYRTELGAPGGGTTETTLTPHELADLLSYTLVNAPPDPALLDAANAGMLTRTEQIAAQVDRLLQTQPAKDNLTGALLAYFGMKQLVDLKKDPETFPAFTQGLKNSMYAETQRFMSNVLWSGKLTDLLTSRTTYVNEGLAALYGVTYPGTPGGDFMPVELPAGQRSGLLTQGSILATRARTKTTSVVARGLFINGAVLCLEKPPAPPKTVQAQVDAQLSNETETERQKADFRAKTSPCFTCHASFDPYGLLLESYDGIGRFRSEYAPGVTIDTTTKLPAKLGGGDVKAVTDLVSKVTTDGTFSSCMTANLMKYALTDASALGYSDCAVAQTHEQFLKTGQSFSDLVRGVLTSKTLTTRSVVKE